MDQTLRGEGPATQAIKSIHEMDGAIEKMLGDRYIVSVFYFPNGNVAVCDQHGQQIPEFQSGTGKEMQPLIDAQLARQSNSAIIRGKP